MRENNDYVDYISNGRIFKRADAVRSEANPFSSSNGFCESISVWLASQVFLQELHLSTTSSSAKDKLPVSSALLPIHWILGES